MLFIAGRKPPKPFAPAAHVTGRLRVPLPAPDARRPGDWELGTVYPGRAAHVDRVPRGGYARAPPDMNYQPEGRVPRHVDHPGAGFGYNRPSVYGAGLVDLPSEFTFRLLLIYLLATERLFKRLDLWLIGLTRLILILTIASFVTSPARVYVV